MKPEHYQYILALLFSTRDSVLAEKLHVEHQLSLPHNHRVLDADDSELENTLMKIRVEYSKINEAAHDFQRNFIPESKPSNNGAKDLLY